MVTIRLEQELYTVNEDEGLLTVCAQIVDGSPSRPVSFSLSFFQGPGDAVGEFGYGVALVCDLPLFCLHVLFHEPQMVLTSLGSQLT